MTKFKSVVRLGYHWLVAENNGIRYFLYPMAKQGDRHDVRGNSRVKLTTVD